MTQLISPASKDYHRAPSLGRTHNADIEFDYLGDEPWYFYGQAETFELPPLYEKKQEVGADGSPVLDDKGQPKMIDDTSKPPHRVRLYRLYTKRVEKWISTYDCDLYQELPQVSYTETYRGRARWNAMVSTIAIVMYLAFLYATWQILTLPPTALQLALRNGTQMAEFMLTVTIVFVMIVVYRGMSREHKVFKATLRTFAHNPASSAKYLVEDVYPTNMRSPLDEYIAKVSHISAPTFMGFLSAERDMLARNMSLLQTSNNAKDTYNSQLQLENLNLGLTAENTRQMGRIRRGVSGGRSTVHLVIIGALAIALLAVALYAFGGA